MEVSDELLFFFSGLGSFNGLLLSFYFIFWAKPNSQSSKFLGIFLFMLSSRVTKSVFFYFNPDIDFIYLQLGLSACFFIGPFLYFYFASISSQKEKFNLKWRKHLYVLVPVILFVNIFFPFEINFELWNTYIIRGIYSTWVIYSLLASYQIRDSFLKMINKTQKLDAFDFWVLSICIGNFLILAAYLFYGITSYILGALLFSFLFYILLILLFYRFKNKQYQILNKQSYGGKKIENSKELITRLNFIMENEKLYRDPLLKLSSLATKLNIPTHTLSQLLNENLKKGFFQYINEYRINEACEIIKKQNNLKIDSVGYDVGYNSKSTFYTAFKKITGTTPANYNTQNNT